MSRAGPIRVTVIGPLPPTRGISPYVLALVTALASSPQVAVDVLGFRSLYPRRIYPGGDTTDDTSTSPGPPETVRVRNVLTWWNPLGWITAGLTLRGDVVHAQWWSFILAPTYLTVLLLARLRKKRVVLTVHNVAPHEGGIVRRLMNRSVLPLADVILVHSERNREAIRQLVHDTPVYVVPHGALPLAPSREDDRDGARARLCLPLGAQIILSFGHVRPYKGIAELIDAFALVHARRPSAHLVIAGQTWEPWEPYQQRISELRIAHAVTVRLGFVPEPIVPELFAAADVAVLPYTHFDGQSGAGTLALSAGLPLLVTDVGGLPDLVGSPQAIVPPGSVADLAAAMLRVLEEPDLRARLAADSARRAREMSWDRIAESMTGVYRQCGGQRERLGVR